MTVAKITRKALALTGGLHSALISAATVVGTALSSGAKKAHVKALRRSVRKASLAAIQSRQYLDKQGKAYAQVQQSQQEHLAVLRRNAKDVTKHAAVVSALAHAEVKQLNTSLTKD